MKTILVLAPHTDDGEFGCGGTIAKMIGEGAEVHYIAFSAAEESVGTEWPRDVLREEVERATKILGVQHLEVCDYKVRHFLSKRQEILNQMFWFQKDLKPDVVFLPSTADTHQDHQVISSEGFRAFKKTTILGYELPWNNLTFSTNAFTMLSEDNMQAKVNALVEYRSQANRLLSPEESVRCLARVRGDQIGTKYAEAFEAIRWMIR